MCYNVAMDGQQYLNQISANIRPAKKSKPGIFTSKFFWIGVIGVVAFVFIAIIGAALGGNKGGEKNNSIRLALHVENTSEIVKTYQPDVKSSKLRGYSSSLYGLMTEIDKDLTEYIESKYGLKSNNLEKSVDKNLAEEATTMKDGLESELFEAKINGVLDRVFAHKMAYEITLLMSEESSLIKSTKNDELKEKLSTSYTSLENLYNSFNDFSETK